MPFAEPGDAQPPNLTPAGRLPLWSEAEFIATVREGQAPGRRLTDGMPRYQMNDEDLAAIFLYLNSLEPVEKGN